MTRHDHTPDPPPDPAFVAALEAYSLAERSRVIPPPPAFTDRVLQTVHARRVATRQLRRTLIAAAVSLAAAVLVTVSVVASRSPDRLVRPVDDIAKRPPPVMPDVVTPTDPPPRVGDAFADAGDAIASLSQRTADKAVRPTRSLVGAGWGQFTAPPSAAVPDVQPAADTLAAVPSSARSSVEPLTSNTRRAFRLLLRDTGLQSSKTKS